MSSMFIPKCHVFSKISKFSKYLSLGIQIRPWPFNPIFFALKISKFSKYLSLGIQIWPWLFNPIFFAKYQNFQNASLLGFKFGHDHLILSLLPQKYHIFQDTSLLGFKFSHDSLILSLFWDSNLAGPFNPISFASKISKISKYLSLGIQIRQRPFNPISFASTIPKFSKYLSLRI